MHSPSKSGAIALSLVSGLALLSAYPALAQTNSGLPQPAFHSTKMTEGEKPDSGTASRVDSDMAKVLTKLQQLGVKPTESRSVAEARSQPTPADAVKAVLRDQGKDPAALMAAMKVSKKDMNYEAGKGMQPVRIYTPEGVEGPLPVIVYYHGGGWVIADIDTYEASAMALAKKTGAIVASVEYRRAPENKFPAAHEDAFAGYKWVLAHASEFGGDAKRVAVAGESAGGNLAANVAIMARDMKVQPPVHMALIYPVAGTDMNTPSYMENQNAMPLSKGGMAWFVNHVLAKPEDAMSPMLNLTTAVDLKGLPGATVITAEIDPLMSEGKALADKLKSAGVETGYLTQDGVTHEYFGMDAVVGDAADAQDYVVKNLKAAFKASK